VHVSFCAPWWVVGKVNRRICGFLVKMGAGRGLENGFSHGAAWIMVDRKEELAAKLERLLKEAADISVALDRVEGRAQGVPHYSGVEARAHELGRQLSRKIQQRQLGEIAAEAAATAKCPACGTRSALVAEPRTVASIDGPVQSLEPRGYCACCRRSFFPATRSIGL
jgi:hypothetical protein